MLFSPDLHFRALVRKWPPSAAFTGAGCRVVVNSSVRTNSENKRQHADSLAALEHLAFHKRPSEICSISSNHCALSHFLAAGAFLPSWCQPCIKSEVGRTTHLKRRNRNVANQSQASKASQICSLRFGDCGSADRG